MRYTGICHGLTRPRQSSVSSLPFRHRRFRTNAMVDSCKFFFSVRSNRRDEFRSHSTRSLCAPHRALVGTVSVSDFCKLCYVETLTGAVFFFSTAPLFPSNTFWRGGSRTFLIGGSGSLSSLPCHWVKGRARSSVECWRRHRQGIPYFLFGVL